MAPSPLPSPPASLERVRRRSRIHRRTDSDPSVLFSKHRQRLALSLSLKSSSSSSSPSQDIESLQLQLHESIQTLGEANNPHIGRLYNCIGNVYFRLEQFELASEAYGYALESYRQVGGKNHPYVAVSLGNLGTAYWKLGEYAESIRNLEESLRILRRKSGGSDDDVMVTEALHNLGSVKLLKGDLTGAKEVLERALRGRKRVLGKYHVDVARTRESLGLVYMKMGDTKLAMKHHVEALYAKKSMLGNEHPSTICSLMNLARVYRHMGDWEGAIDLYREAFEVQSKLSLDDKAMLIESGVTLQMIGDLQTKKMSLFGALSTFKQAQSIYEGLGLDKDDRRMQTLMQSQEEAEELLKDSGTYIIREHSASS